MHRTVPAPHLNRMRTEPRLYLRHASHVMSYLRVQGMLRAIRVLSTGGGGAGGKLPPQNLVTDHGIQEIFVQNHIKSDLKTPQNQKISWGILPQIPYTMCTSVVSYCIHCIVRRFPPKSTFLDRTLAMKTFSEKLFSHFFEMSILVVIV